MSTRSCLILLSGGLDSTTLLADMLRGPSTVGAIAIDYGQRHRRELDSARHVAAHYAVRLHNIDLSSWGALLAGSALTDPDVPVPRGLHFEDEGQATTVVPNRNAVLLSVAASVALAHGYQHIATAVHAGDHAVYPDCRPDFLAAFEQVLDLGTEGKVGLLAPYAHLTKAEIAHRARRFGVPVELTWSCYEGGTQPCGACGACIERSEALAATAAVVA